MKFATLALIGTTAALRVDYSAEDVKSAYMQAMKIMKHMESIDASITAEEKQKMEMKKAMLMKWAMSKVPKYQEPMRLHTMSKENKEKERYFWNELVPSDEVQEIPEDFMEIVKNFQTHEWKWGKGFNKDGSYSEWMDNEDLGEYFEALYDIKEDLKTLVESKVMRGMQERDLAAFNEPNMQKMFKMVMDDVNIHSCEELKARLTKIAMKMKKKLKNCPHRKQVKQLKMMVVKLMMHIKKAQKWSDVPDRKKVEAWWNEHDFQPWM